MTLFVIARATGLWRAILTAAAARSERDADLLGDRYDLDSAPNR